MIKAKAGALLVFFLIVGISAKVGANISWCQHDDPAYVEPLRKKQGISNQDVGTQVPCPAVADPSKYPKQLVLPMPCGRRMVFQRVEFRLEHALDQVLAHLGSVPDTNEGDEAIAAVSASINGPWTDSISGGFSNGNGDGLARYYYIGKYEVSALQYDLMRLELLKPGAVSQNPDDPACTEYATKVKRARGTRVLPAVGVTWIDAVTFAHHYSEWLLNLDRQRIKKSMNPYIPWKDSAPGFLRLPTEAEWEFAARGSIADSATQSQRFYEVVTENQQLRTPSLKEIAFVRTAQDSPPAGSQVDYIGRRMPNRLGLYDMIGNADEIVFDLFRPTRPDNLAGQRGGFVVRGGSASGPRDSIGVGYRKEVPFFSSRGPIRSQLTGFRLLVSVPFYVNRRDANFQELQGNMPAAQAILKSRAILLSAPGSLDLQTALETTQGELDRLRAEKDVNQTDFSKLKATLGRIKADLEKSITQLNERDKRIQREQFMSAVLMLENIRNLFIRIYIAERRIKKLENDIRENPNHPNRRQIESAIPKYRQRLTELRLANDANFENYITTVYALAAAGQDAAAAAGRAAAEHFEARALTIFSKMQAKVSQHIQQTISAGGVLPQSQTDKWQKEIKP